MRATYLRLALVALILCLALLNCLNAVPITRTKSLMHGVQDHDVLKSTLKVNAVKRLEVETVKGRMEIELNDYPGSGANNRHTPRSQTGG